MNPLLEYLNNTIKPLKSSQPLKDAEELFYELPYSHFPITENHIYIGTISRENAEIGSAENLISDKRYDFDRFYVRSNMNWLDVLEVFAKNETNLVPVLDEKNQYVGYYELEDVIRFLHETPFLKENGGILVVKKEANAFSMSQIAQIVESNNGKLLGLFISKIDGHFVEITVKVSQTGLNDIIQTFRRYEYEIISEHQEDTYLKNLKERSDYLDRYLNI